MTALKKKVDLKTLLRRYSVALILLLMCAVLALLSRRFLSTTNLINIALQTSIVALVAIGMTFTILTGGIDLSVGSLVALCGAVSAGLVTRSGFPIAAAFAAAIFTGCAFGTISGLLIVKGNIPPFVATLSMMAVGRGLTLVYTQGKPIAGMGDAFVFWGTGKLGPIPVPVLILLLIFLLSYLVLHHTRFGLHIYAIGGNEDTVRLAGIKNEPRKIAVYVISGFTSALAGVLLTARLWSAQPTAGIGLELEAIASTVLGGTSLMGGSGGTGGTVVGAFIMGVLSNGLNLLEVPAYYQRIVKGIIFILAVMLDLYTKRVRGSRQLLFGELKGAAGNKGNIGEPPKEP